MRLFLIILLPGKLFPAKGIICFCLVIHVVRVFVFVRNRCMKSTNNINSPILVSSILLN